MRISQKPRKGYDIFLNKYTATHEQVTRSAPDREPDDTWNPYINTSGNFDTRQARTSGRAATLAPPRGRPWN